MYSTDELIDRVRELEAELASRPKGVSATDPEGEVPTASIYAEPRCGGTGTYMSVDQNGVHLAIGLSNSETTSLIEQLQDSLRESS